MPSKRKSKKRSSKRKPKRVQRRPPVKKSTRFNFPSSKVGLAGLGVVGAGLGVAATIASMKRNDKQQQLKVMLPKVKTDATTIVSQLRNNHEARDKFKNPSITADKIIVQLNKIIEHEKTGNSNLVNSVIELNAFLQRVQNKISTGKRIKETLSSLDIMDVNELIKKAYTMEEELANIRTDIEDDNAFRGRLQENKMDVDKIIRSLQTITDTFTEFLFEAREKKEHLDELYMERRGFNILPPAKSEKQHELYLNEMKYLLQDKLDQDRITRRANGGSNIVEQGIERFKRDVTNLKKVMTDVELALIPLREHRSSTLGKFTRSLFGL